MSVCVAVRRMDALAQRRAGDAVQLPAASATAVPSTVSAVGVEQRHRRARLGAAARCTVGVVHVGDVVGVRAGRTKRVRRRHQVRRARRRRRSGVDRDRQRRPTPRWCCRRIVGLRRRQAMDAIAQRRAGDRCSCPPSRHRRPQHRRRVRRTASPLRRFSAAAGDASACVTLVMLSVSGRDRLVRRRRQVGRARRRRRGGVDRHRQARPRPRWCCRRCRSGCGRQGVGAIAQQPSW